jgi:hypothetical protein
VTPPVRASEPASAELREAVRWYEDRRTGLGAEFFDAILAALLFVSENPTAGASISRDASLAAPSWSGSPTRSCTASGQARSSSWQSPI